MGKKSTDKRRALWSLGQLLGPTTGGVPQQITALQLKQIHRLRVFENHPDRACILGRSARSLEQQLASINVAYDFLTAQMINDVLYTEPFTGEEPRTQEGAGQASPPIGYSSKSRGESRMEGQSGEVGYRCRELRYAGVMEDSWDSAIPQRRLRFGRFLYYSGAIKWGELVRAVQWQVKQRPRFGEIARELGYLTRVHVQGLAERGGGDELIGEIAVRKGFLTNFQRLVVLGRQLKLQPPIGQYFVATGLLTKTSVDSYLTHQRRHNGMLRKRGISDVA